MSSPEFSVIVPVYNTEKYLASCLDSIVGQCFKDFEVILVDDGSSDSSSDICRRYVNHNKNFSYFRKENGGLSSARNAGLALAIGKWIAFVDSDDSIDSDYLDCFARIIDDNDESDMIIGGMTLHKNGRTSVLKPPEIDSPLTRREYVRMVLARKMPIFLFQCAWAKVYNHSFLKEQHLLFDEACRLNEDCLFNTELLVKQFHRMRFCQMHSYHYNQDNITSNSHIKKSIQNIESLIDIGSRTIAIRHSLMDELGFEHDSDVKAGVQKAIGIVCLSNTRLIENEIDDREMRWRLYEQYWKCMPYGNAEEKIEHIEELSAILPLPYNPEYSWVDNKIIHLNCMMLQNDNHWLNMLIMIIIHSIYSVRKLRKRLS